MTRTLRVFVAGILGLICGGRQCEAQSEIALVDGPGWEATGQTYLAVGGLGHWPTESEPAVATELGMTAPRPRPGHFSSPRSNERTSPTVESAATHYPIRDQRDWYLLAIVGLTFAIGCTTTSVLWWKRKHQPRWMLSDFAH